MHGFKRHLTAAVALTCGVAALTGSALAAPPSTPPGQEQAADPAAPPATPPGQEKKAEQAPAPAPAASEPKGKATAPGQQKKAERAAPAASNSKKAEKPAPKSSKPSTNPNWWNAQNKPKHNVPPAAASVPDFATGLGPGKSGKHKVTLCHKGHAITVDVHALKGHMKHGDTYLPFNTKGTCGAAFAAGAANAAVSSSAGSAAAGAPGAPGAALAAGGVAGAEKTLSGAGGKGEAGGVAGAFATIGGVAAGSLPFTGFPLWAVALIALTAIAIGWTLWRRSRGPVTTDAV
jgi:hypothetical protein